MANSTVSTPLPLRHMKIVFKIKTSMVRNRELKFKERKSQGQV
jgi:hypothetical protein